MISSFDRGHCELPCGMEETKLWCHFSLGPKSSKAERTHPETNR